MESARPAPSAPLVGRLYLTVFFGVEVSSMGIDGPHVPGYAALTFSAATFGRLQVGTSLTFHS